MTVTSVWVRPQWLLMEPAGTLIIVRRYCLLRSSLGLPLIMLEVTVSERLPVLMLGIWVRWLSSG